MKSKFKERKAADLDKSLQDFDEFDDENSSDVDDGITDVAPSKGSKIIVITASAIFITAVLYFFLFSGDSQKTKEENLEEVSNENPISIQSPAPAEKKDPFEDFVNEDDIILDKPNIPKLPDLPESSNKDDSGFVNKVLPTILDVPADDNKDDNKKIDQGPPPFNASQPYLPSNDKQQNNNSVSAIPLNPRYSPIIVGGDPNNPNDPNSQNVQQGGVGGTIFNGPSLGIGYENNIVSIYKDPLDDLPENNAAAKASIIKNKQNTVAQGKIILAVLETSINTELPGSIRGIISRDVYAESGSDVIIPKGSRLFGSYSGIIKRGQARVEINWTRLIRPDGVDINIAFRAADQFGRSGIEGDVDNRYSSIIANSILTSVLAVGGAIAAEKLADSGNNSATTTTNPQTGTSTSSGSASSKAIYDVTKTITDTVSNIANNNLNTSPTIRIPQGTRMTVIVNQDMVLPPFKESRK